LSLISGFLVVTEVEDSTISRNEERAQQSAPFREARLLYTTVSLEDDLSDRLQGLGEDPSRDASADTGFVPRSTETAKAIAALAAFNLDLVFANSLANLLKRSKELSSAQGDNVYDIIVIGAGVREVTRNIITTRFYVRQGIDPCRVRLVVAHACATVTDKCCCGYTLRCMIRLCRTRCVPRRQGCAS
jgi:hypothetical protein